MKKYLPAYISAVLAMLALDVIWIGFVAKNFYQVGIGHLMADSPYLPAALLFYLVYPLGLMVFVIVPAPASAKGLHCALKGALYGFFAYATYDLSNWATLSRWPASIAIVDMVWGALASACASACGWYVWNRSKESA